MIFLFVFVTAFLIPVYAAYRAGRPLCGRKLARITAAFACLFMLLLALVDHYDPFMPGGDDYGYYIDSTYPFQSLEAVIYSIAGSYEQPGYPVFLNLINLIAGDSLYARKSANLGLLLLISVFWYGIGKEIGGERTAQTFFLGILLATPLWFYFFFLFKDMSIIFFFSMFILGATQFFTHGRGASLMLISSFGLALFRLPLLLINAAVLLVFAFLAGKGGGVGRFLAAISFFLLVATVGFYPEVVDTFGIPRAGSVSVQSMVSRAQEYNAMVEGNPPAKSVLLYFMIETSGLRSLGTWDDTSFRGITALPWIFAGLPFFFIGTYRILTNRVTNTWNRILLCLLVIVLIYLAVSLIVKDTTRWRIPGFPAMVSIAAVGWLEMEKKRLPLLAATTSSSVIAFVLYYLLKE